jgi:hypothetical protein
MAARLADEGNRAESASFSEAGFPVPESRVGGEGCEEDGGRGDDGSEAGIQEDFLQLPELRPPNIMPRGNVGTSTQGRNSSLKSSETSAIVGRVLCRDM